MKRVTYLTAIALLMAGGVVACDNRRAERSGGAETGTAGGAGTAGGTGTTGGTGMTGDTVLSKADKKAGRTVEVPGDSIRLEDTLSQPPPSSDTTK